MGTGCQIAGSCEWVQGSKVIAGSCEWVQGSKVVGDCRIM